MSDHLELLARVYGGQHTGLYPSLDKSLNPRGPELLFDVAAEYLAPRSRILDIGCRDAAYLIRLVQAHDARGGRGRPARSAHRPGRGCRRRGRAPRPDQDPQGSHGAHRAAR